MSRDYRLTSDAKERIEAQLHQARAVCRVAAIAAQHSESDIDRDHIATVLWAAQDLVGAALQDLERAQASVVELARTK